MITSYKNLRLPKQTKKAFFLHLYIDRPYYTIKRPDITLKKSENQLEQAKVWKCIIVLQNNFLDYKSANFCGQIIAY